MYWRKAIVPVGCKAALWSTSSTRSRSCVAMWAAWCVCVCMCVNCFNVLWKWDWLVHITAGPGLLGWTTPARRPWFWRLSSPWRSLLSFVCRCNLYSKTPALVCIWKKKCFNIHECYKDIRIQCSEPNSQLLNSTKYSALPSWAIYIYIYKKKAKVVSKHAKYNIFATLKQLNFKSLLLIHTYINIYTSLWVGQHLKPLSFLLLFLKQLLSGTG